MIATSIKQTLASYLRADFDISQRVGGRVYLTVAPQRASLPYVVIQQISADHIRHMTAASGLVDASFQINAVAKSPLEADNLANEIRERLDHLLNTVVGSPPYDSRIHFAALAGHIDDFVSPTDASGVGVFVVRMDWTVWHTETVPTFA